MREYYILHKKTNQLTLYCSSSNKWLTRVMRKCKGYCTIMPMILIITSVGNISWRFLIHIYVKKKSLDRLTLTYRSEMTWKATQSENLGWTTSFLTLCSLLPCGELKCGVQCLLKAAQVQSDSVLPVTTLVRGRFRDRLFLLKVSIANGTHTHSHSLQSHFLFTSVQDLCDKPVW